MFIQVNHWMSMGLDHKVILQLYLQWYSDYSKPTFYSTNALYQEITWWALVECGSDCFPSYRLHQTVASNGSWRQHRMVVHSSFHLKTQLTMIQQHFRGTLRIRMDQSASDTCRQIVLAQVARQYPRLKRLITAIPWSRCFHFNSVLSEGTTYNDVLHYSQDEPLVSSLLYDQQYDPELIHCLLHAVDRDNAQNWYKNNNIPLMSLRQLLPSCLRELRLLNPQNIIVHRQQPQPQSQQQEQPQQHQSRSKHYGVQRLECYICDLHMIHDTQQQMDQVVNDTFFPNVTILRLDGAWHWSWANLWARAFSSYQRIRRMELITTEQSVDIHTWNTIWTYLWRLDTLIIYPIPKPKAIEPIEYSLHPLHALRHLEIAYTSAYVHHLKQVYEQTNNLSINIPYLPKLELISFRFTCHLHDHWRHLIRLWIHAWTKRNPSIRLIHCYDASGVVLNHSDKSMKNNENTNRYLVS